MDNDSIIENFNTKENHTGKCFIKRMHLAFTSSNI